MTTPYLSLAGSLNLLAGVPQGTFSEDAAACKWAGVPIGSFTLIGALNKKNGTFGGSRMLDLGGVCNALAGTTGLSPAAALAKLAGETGP